VTDQLEIEALIIRLRDGSEWYLAAGQLEEIGAPAVDLLCQALLKQRFTVPDGEYYDDYWRAKVADSLGQIGDPRAVEPLIFVLLHDDNLDVRTWAATALARIGDERAIEPMKQVYFSITDQDARYNIAEALMDFGIDTC
jgi:HEAT repeat protein